MRFSNYHPASSKTPGAIDCVGYCHPSQIEIQAAPGMGFWSGEDEVDLDLDYFDLTRDPPEPTRRPELPGFDRLAIDADGEDAAVLALAGPFKATIDGTEYEIATPGEDGLFRLFLAADVPAVYSVQVEAWPYLPYSAEVTAT